MRPRVTLQLPMKTVLPPIDLNGARILLIGHGYVAQSLTRHLAGSGARVQWTHRTKAAASPHAISFGSPDMQLAFSKADFVLSSVPPDRSGSDPTLDALTQRPSQARWIGYLSATSVYGDRAGQWAFESEAPTPGISRGIRRAKAELAWLERYPMTQIFRLAGIYGPGRVPFDRIQSGDARIVDAPGHVVNRIHIDDIVSALIASFARPSPQDIYNIADGHPAPPGDVLSYAAQLIGQKIPPTVSVDDPSVSTMAKSFYAETKRIDISRAKTRLQWAPLFKTYHAGLDACLLAKEVG